MLSRALVRTKRGFMSRAGLLVVLFLLVAGMCLWRGLSLRAACSVTCPCGQGTCDAYGNCTCPQPGACGCGEASCANGAWQCPQWPNCADDETFECNVVSGQFVCVPEPGGDGGGGDDCSDDPCQPECTFDDEGC